jgi:non-canonical poly(A) RNA polymerase PAPD5/7
MILVVKAFLSQRSMNEVYSGGLGSYSVICLVISFLQVCPAQLTSITADRKVHPKLRRNEIDPEQNMGTLLMEFFELYGKHFNYDEVGISIRKGGFYYSKRSRGWYRGGQAYLLSVEDPQDPGSSHFASYERGLIPDNDISGGSFGIRQVKLTLNGAFSMLQEALCQRARTMVGDKEWYRAGDDDPEELTILGKVMGVTREVSHITLDQVSADGTDGKTSSRTSSIAS